MKVKKKKKDTAVEENQEEEKSNENADEEAAQQQKKMLDELEAGGFVEDIDLTTDDWVNVSPADYVTRYDMLRRYVR